MPKIKKTSKGFLQYIQPEDVESILSLFYRTELREGEKIIDNTSVSISKELNINVQNVNDVITKHLKNKYKNWPPNE